MRQKLSNSQKLRPSLNLKRKIVLGIFAGCLGFFLFCLFELASTLKSSTAFSNTSKHSQKQSGSNPTSKINSCGSSKNDHLSICTWIKFSDENFSDLNTSTILANSSKNYLNFGQYWLRHNKKTNKIEFTISTSNGHETVQSKTAPETNTWYHVACVYNGNQIQLFINGNLEGDLAHTGEITKYWQFTISSYGELTSGNEIINEFKGKLAGLYILDISLQKEQINKFLCFQKNILPELKILNSTAIANYEYRGK